MCVCVCECECVLRSEKIDFIFNRCALALMLEVPWYRGSQAVRRMQMITLMRVVEVAVKSY